MKANVGSYDRIIRLIAGLVAIGLGIYFQSWWGALGVVLIITAAFSFCPLYPLLGINTCMKSTTGK